MKVVPVAPGQGGMSVPGTSTTLTTGRANGVPLPTSTFDPQVEAAREAAKSRSIKLRVNQTPTGREYPLGTDAPPPGTEETAATAPAPTEVPVAAAPAPTEAPAPAAPAPVSESSIAEQATATAEETKPLSPQQVAIARQRRALQVKERELAAREKALTEQTPKVEVPDFKARLKAEPLSVLQEAGVTYDQLTEAILAGKETSPEIYELREQIKALKEGFDKSLSDRDSQAEAAAFSEMTDEAQTLASQGDDFELVRETKSIPKVMDLIRRTWQQDKKILPVHTAMRLVEDELVEHTSRVAALKKIQSRLAPKAPTAPVVPAPAAPEQPGMRTLTNRDTTSVPLSRKERAMQAFYGKK